MASGRSWLSGSMEDTLVSMAKSERPLCVVYEICMLAKNRIRGSIVVSISALVARKTWAPFPAAEIFMAL